MFRKIVGKKIQSWSSGWGVRIGSIFMLIFMLATISSNVRVDAQGLSQPQNQTFQSGVLYFDTDTGSCSSNSSVSSTPAGTLPSIIPEPYNGAFTAGANNHNVAPALVAAIFTEEHFTKSNPSQLPGLWAQLIKTHPDPNSGWASSSAGAQGPFQFEPLTWVGLGYNIADINNLVTAADAAADYLARNGGTLNNPPSKWQNAIFNYNHAQWYVDAVMLYYQYYTTGDTSTTIPTPSSTISSCSTSTGASSTGSYQNPLRSVKQLRPERIDQGVDYAGQGPVYALGDGIIENLTNSGWNFGGYDAFITEKLTDGPASGDYVYVAEACVPVAILSIGQTVDSNTIICNMINPSGSGIETGWAKPPGNGAAMASNVYQEGASTAFGANYNQLLVSLGAPSGVQEGGLVGTLPANWPTW